MVQFILRNWLLLLVIFGLGGTAAVVGVVPGVEGLQDPINVQIEATAAKLVSDTTVQ